MNPINLNTIKAFVTRPTKERQLTELAKVVDIPVSMISPNPDQPTPPSGTYENARLSMMTIKDDVQEVLDIPIKLVASA